MNNQHGFPPGVFGRGEYRLEIVIGYRNGQYEVDTLVRNNFPPDTRVNKTKPLTNYRSDYQSGSSLVSYQPNSLVNRSVLAKGSVIGIKPRQNRLRTILSLSPWYFHDRID